MNDKQFKAERSRDELTDYPYNANAPDHSAVSIVRNWCQCGGRNPPALVRDYLAGMNAPRLAAVIKGNWRVKATLAELHEAAEAYRKEVLG